MKNSLPLVIFAVCLAYSTVANAQEDESPQMSFRDPVVVEGAPDSIVRDIESAVIIPGSTHEELWVHPNLVTIPGDPVAVEFSLRSTDRHGRDKHATFNCFRTDDDFKTIHPIAERSEEPWRRIGLKEEDFTGWRPLIPDMKNASWHWARNSIHLDAETILYPYVVLRDKTYSIFTIAARESGDRFKALYGSNGLTNNIKRGFLEPQIALYKGRHYMTMRAEDGCGYVTTSDNEGRSWQKAKAWTWDNGSKVSMHTTMTKLLSHSDGLVLVYTRIRDDNHDVFRNRAPLHCADVDPASLSLKQSTERIIVPNKGKPIGNFWVWPINQDKSYVAVAEWPRDGREENGDTWLAKIYWKRPNQKITPDGHERLP